MGWGLDYKCSKCSNVVTLLYHRGFDYEFEPESIFREMLSGKYGEKLQKLAENHNFDDTIILNEPYGFTPCICKECANIENIFCLKVVFSDIEEEIIPEYKCSQCGEQAELIPESIELMNNPEKLSLNCPKCKNLLHYKMGFFWD